MTFLRSKTFFALIAGISLARLVFFILASLGDGFQNFSGSAKLYQLNYEYFAAPVIQSIGILILVFIPIVLFSSLSERIRNILGEKIVLIALALNSLLLFIYLLAELIIWGSGFNLETVIYFVVSLTFLILPLIGFILVGFSGFASFIFLFLTTLIQIGLLSSIFLLKRFEKDRSTERDTPAEWKESSNSQSTNRNGSQKMNQNKPTWTVRIPGQPENPVDTATLQNWAKSGFVKADTMVTEVATGYVYQAKQIPGVFSSKSYVTALLLSFFFGVFGVDRFYLGHVGVGLGKLFTFGGLGIWALIDFILIATKNIKDNQGIPLA